MKTPRYSRNATDTSAARVCMPPTPHGPIFAHHGCIGSGTDPSTRDIMKLYCELPRTKTLGEWMQEIEFEKYNLDIRYECIHSRDCACAGLNARVVCTRS